MTQQIDSELPEVEPKVSAETDQGRRGIDSVLPGESIYSEKHEAQALEKDNHTPTTQLSAAQHMLAQQTSVTQPAVSVTGDSGTGSPQIADDTDLIEKEWVLKAKEIVDRTKHDPYQQNKGVERLKADYMQKRYSKEIKLTED